MIFEALQSKKEIKDSPSCGASTGPGDCSLSFSFLTGDLSSVLRTLAGVGPPDGPLSEVSVGFEVFEDFEIFEIFEFFEFEPRLRFNPDGPACVSAADSRYGFGSLFGKVNGAAGGTIRTVLLCVGGGSLISTRPR